MPDISKNLQHDKQKNMNTELPTRNVEKNNQNIPGDRKNEKNPTQLKKPVGDEKGYRGAE